MLHLTIHLSDDLQTDLEWLSHRNNKPLDAVITESLRHYLAQIQLQTLALQTLDNAGTWLEDTEAMKYALKETQAVRNGEACG